MLSISIVTYRIDEALFRRVLDHLRRAVTRWYQTAGSPVSVTIIDNGRQDALLRRLGGELECEALRCKLITGLNNIGYGRAHNLAILTSESTYHLILNPDVLLDEDSLVKGLAFMEDNPDVCAVAPYATGADGRVQYLCKHYPSVVDLLLRGFAPAPARRWFRGRLERYELRDVVATAAVERVPLISGCFMLCATEKLKHIGGFDERFFLYFEDFALSLELGKLGTLAYLPEVKIVHFGGNCARKGLRHIWMFMRSGITFFNIYGWKVR